MKRSDLTPEFVASVIRFDGERFFWRERHDSFLKRKDAWNRNFAGKPVAIQQHRNGYLSVKISSITILAHRLVWVLHHGAWPTGDLDHLNGVRTDNRIENLRCVTKSENQRNQRLRFDNKSGATGVYWCNTVRKWVARLMVEGRTIHIGFFTDLQEAIAARRTAQLQYGFTSRHGLAA